VVKQAPTADTKAKFGSTVTIFVPPSGSLVPAVVGDDYQVALGKLSNAGFSNINVVNVTNPNVPNGTVVAQTPHAGQRVPASTQINLSVVKNAATPSPAPTTPSPTPTLSPTPSPTGT
jgi:serine/threonine-protein kinase